MCIGSMLLLVLNIPTQCACTHVHTHVLNTVYPWNNTQKTIHLNKTVPFTCITSLTTKNRNCLFILLCLWPDSVSKEQGMGCTCYYISSIQHNKYPEQLHMNTRKHWNKVLIRSNYVITWNFHLINISTLNENMLLIW